MPYLRAYCLVLLMLAWLPVSASTQGKQQATNANDYYLAIKGGVSLGSYESGINYILLKYIQEQEQNGSKLVSFSGASAGSINSLLSAVQHCYRENIYQGEVSDVDNLMRNTWDIGIEQLLGDGSDKTAGLFSRDILRQKIRQLKDKINNNVASNDCELVITMSMTRVKPLKITLENTRQEISLQRFVVPIMVMARRGEKLQFRNYLIRGQAGLTGDTDNLMRLEKVAQILPGPYVQLPENPDRSIDIDRIIDVALASSAFPIAFQPKKIAHCFDTEAYQSINEQICTAQSATIARFSDGGLFDNSPVGVVRDVMRVNQQTRDGINNHKVMFFINPDHYRPLVTRVGDYNYEYPQIGLADYAFYLMDSFNTATSTEFKKGLVEFENDTLAGRNITPVVTTRYHNLLADFHAHFGAFYSSDFRTHDYLVGIYDGIVAISKQYCLQQSQAEINYQDCVQRETYDWMHEKLILADDDNRYINFLRYLYNMEFKGAIELVAPGDNIYIALAESFPDPSKQNVSGLSLNQYIINLKTLLYEDNTSQFYQGDKSQRDRMSLTEGTIDLLNDYHQWRSDSYRDAFRNLKDMQYRSTTCAKCDNPLNSVIANVLELSDPIASSVFSYTETGAWPLAHRLGKNGSVSLFSGYEYLEASPVYTLAYRLRLSPGISTDLSLNYHDLQDDRLDDDYTSFSVGANYHFESILIQTLGGGIDYSRESEENDDSLNAVYLALGVVNELITMKLSYRAESLNEQVAGTRERTQFLLQFDLTKIADIIF